METPKQMGKQMKDYLEGTVTLPLGDYEILVDYRDRFKKFISEKTLIRHPNKIDFSIYTSDGELSKFGKENEMLRYDNDELRYDNKELRKKVQSLKEEVIQINNAAQTDKIKALNMLGKRIRNMNYWEFRNWKKQYLQDLNLYVYLEKLIENDKQ